MTTTQASAIVTRCGEDVTDEYTENAFHWTRDSGNIEADTVWNAAHAGMKSITFAVADIDGDVKISCTLTANGATYGSIAVDGNMDASHTPAELDANDVFVIENGNLKVTTSRGNAYVLENGTLKAAGAKLNGSITSETKLFASQPENIVEFSYDHNGLRTQKKVTRADGTVKTTDYVLHGKLLTHLRRGNDEMHFFYDAQKQPILMEYNGETYSYLHNLQGDIVGILDSSGNVVLEYGYDAWGKPVVVRTLTTAYETLAELNPFRYRWYMFDEEVGLYYLRNRYYDSLVTFFLNLDNNCGKNGMILAHNGYCYCNNNPIAYVDPEGKNALFALDRVITGVLMGALIGACIVLKSHSSNRVPSQINPFEDDPDAKGPNETYTLDFYVTRPWYVGVSQVEEYNEVITQYEENEAALRADLWTIGWSGLGFLANPVVGLITGIGSGLMANHNVIDFSAGIDYGEVSPGLYFTQVAVYYTYSEGQRTTYVARRTISQQNGSALNSDWEYFAMGESVELDTAWDMALLPYPYPV